VIHRESGVLKTTYEADMALYPLPIAKWTVAGVALVFFVVLPMVLHEYYLSIINLVSIACIGALGLNILVGYTGQISVGHGAFMSVGAYTAANFAVRLDAPWPVNMLAGGLMAAVVGAIVGIPSLRIKGLYLAIATLAGQLIIEWTINHVTFISGGVQASIEVPPPELFGHRLASQTQMYFFLLAFVVVAVVGTMNLVRSRIGRAFVAIRDQDIAAEIIGINIFRYSAPARATSAVSRWTERRSFSWPPGCSCSSRRPSCSAPPPPARPPTPSSPNSTWPEIRDGDEPIGLTPVVGRLACCFHTKATVSCHRSAERGAIQSVGGRG
jgi:branched-chain amino acid transport system permease protein